MSLHNDPTYAAMLQRLFGEPDDDAPRIRRLSRGRVELNGIVFAPRDGRSSGYHAPWVSVSEDDQ